MHGAPGTSLSLSLFLLLLSCDLSQTLTYRQTHISPLSFLPRLNSLFFVFFYNLATGGLTLQGNCRIKKNSCSHNWLWNSHMLYWDHRAAPCRVQTVGEFSSRQCHQWQWQAQISFFSVPLFAFISLSSLNESLRRYTPRPGSARSYCYRANAAESSAAQS